MATRRERRDVDVVSPDEVVRRGRLGLRRHRPVLAVAGTTAPLDPAAAERLLPVLRAAVGVADRAGAAIVTGGTDAGVLHLLSLAAAAGRASVPVIGVAPDALVVDGPLPAGGHGDGRAALDPRLTALVRVPGEAWGAETGTLSRVVGEVAGRSPAVVLLVGGGEVAAQEVVEHLTQGRTVVVVAGSGLLADAVAALVEPARAGGAFVEPARAGAGGPGPGALDDDLRALVAVGDVRVVPLPAGAAALEAVLADALVARPRRTARQRIPPLAGMPRFRVRPATPASLVGPDAALRYPALAGRLADVDSVVLPAFRASDAEAEREQNRHRWFLLLAIVGGFLTTTFGAVQAWLQSARWPGVAVATLAAATSALTTVTRRDGALSRFVSARVRAERLRSLYFTHLAGAPAASGDAHRAELAALRARVAAIEAEESAR